MVASGARIGDGFSQVRDGILKTYTAKYTKISSGYMAQLVEWPEAITEGETLEDC